MTFTSSLSTRPLNIVFLYSKSFLNALFLARFVGGVLGTIYLLTNEFKTSNPNALLYVCILIPHKEYFVPSKNNTLFIEKPSLFAIVSLLRSPYLIKLDQELGSDTNC